MNVKEENICRLCLKVAENDFELIDEFTRNMFEVILLRVNLDISTDPIICKNCAEVTGKCFNFKSVCMELKDMYRDERETVDDNFLCRFCLNYLSGSNFISLNTLMNDITFAKMLQMIMPDADFNIFKSSVICTLCRQDLDCYIKFVKNCLRVEEKICKYYKDRGTPFSSQIKLSEIQHFFENYIMELDYTQMRAMKQEEEILENIGEAHCEVHYDDELIKVEDVLDIKYEVNFSDCKVEEASQMLSIGDILEEQIFKCALCPYQAKHKYNLKRHEKIHKDNRRLKMYKCSTCTYQTKRKTTLERHKMIHKNITEVEMYKCLICTYETKYKNSLKVHVLVHKDTTEVEMYKCSMCTYETKYKASLKSHVLIHKDITEVEMHKCSMCTYETKYKCNLKGHIVLVHKDITEVKMHKCSMCTYETREKSKLKRHMLIHKDITEVKMYKCSMCTHQTREKSKLERHMIIHKDITEVEMYKCSMCTYETKYKNCIKTHVLTHKNITEVVTFKCSMCPFQTKYKRGLKSHMLRHKDITEEEMYVCTISSIKTEESP